MFFSDYVILGLLLLAALLYLARTRVSRRGDRTRRRDEELRRLLEKEGYEAEAHGEAREMVVFLDGREHRLSVRAPLMVRRSGQRYAGFRCSTKSGRLGIRALRQQYFVELLCFRRLILADVKRQKIWEVELKEAGFPGRFLQ